MIRGMEERSFLLFRGKNSISSGYIFSIRSIQVSKVIQVLNLYRVMDRFEFRWNGVDGLQGWKIRRSKIQILNFLTSKFVSWLNWNFNTRVT